MTRSSKAGSSRVPVTITRAEARKRLIAHLALARPLGRGAAGVRKLLARLRCIQLDPLDVIGTNADLVAMARIDGIERGDVMRHLFPLHAFEHFAKERCILPADAFPYYRSQGHAAQVGWWGHGEREARVDARTVAAVLDEVRKHGPLTARDLTDHGSVIPMDWSGWKGTAKATTMALEILWTRCDVVVAGRTENGSKLYDIPERALRWDGVVAPAPAFARWALHERVVAAGLLSRAGGSHWSMLSSVRSTPLVEEMIGSGELLEVAIEESPRRYLTTAGVLAATARYDDRVRILGPLDPLIWDRDLVRHIFGFDYVWEVYKPESQRRWGWYVCPLLFRDRLAGRVDARIEGGTMVVRKLWIEDEQVSVEQVAAALELHASRCGATRVSMPRRSIRRAHTE